MGIDTVKFDRGELRVVGGDYGTLTVEGLTDEARRTLDTIIAGNRRCGERTSILSLVVEHDNSPDLFESRHAGLEGTTRFEPARGTDDEGGSATESDGTVRPAAAAAERVSEETTTVRTLGDDR